MTPDIRIRPAQEQDIPDILLFIRELAVYEKLEHEVVATPEDLHRHLFGANPKAEVLFLEEHGRKMGFALFFHNFSTFLGKPGLYLEDLFVKPEARGRGYGKRLLGELARTAVKRGCGRLEWSVLNWNRPAIEFYEALGSRPQSEWTVQRLSGEALDRLATWAKGEDAPK